MKLIKAILGSVLTGFGVALTYYVFETLVHSSINFIWLDVFNTEQNWWFVPVLCIGLTLVYFEARHIFDPRSEKQDEGAALGTEPAATLNNYVTVLLIGYLSLLAGASLGPEAILIPACTLVGVLIAKNLSRKDKQTQGLLGLVGVAALFTAFFGSIVAGFLGVYLGLVEAKAKLNTYILALSSIGVVSAYFVLKLIEPSAYFSGPDYSWDFKLSHVLGVVVIFGAGVAVAWAMSYLEPVMLGLKGQIRIKGWRAQALLAGLILSILYIIGGPLVRFTGNEAIGPMVEQSQHIGLLGLIGLMIVKMLAIVWSKVSGYRGGLIFPTALIASTATVICGLYITDVSFIYGVIAFFIGAWAVNRKTHVLF